MKVYSGGPAMWRKWRMIGFGKSMSGEKTLGLSCLSIPRKSKSKGIDHPTQRKPQEASIFKGWEDKLDLRCITDALT